MNHREVEAASKALVAWFQTQGINAHDGAMVMTYTIANMLKHSAGMAGYDPHDVDEIRMILAKEQNKTSH